MRDINRIDPFLHKFAELWRQHPDLRFGQLVEILNRKSGHIELFSIEDDAMQEIVEKMLERKI